MKVSRLLFFTLLISFIFSSCTQEVKLDNTASAEISQEDNESPLSTDCHPAADNSVKATATSTPNFSRSEAVKDAQKEARMDAQNSCAGNCEGKACKFFEQGIETTTTYSINQDKSYSYTATSVVVGRCQCE
ncbi:MAG: hypothetical protein ACLGGV_08050 [Bacteroidia bacterium]